MAISNKFGDVTCTINECFIRMKRQRIPFWWFYIGQKLLISQNLCPFFSIDPRSCVISTFVLLLPANKNAVSPGKAYHSQPIQQASMRFEDLLNRGSSFPVSWQKSEEKRTSPYLNPVEVVYRITIPRPEWHYFLLGIVRVLCQWCCLQFTNFPLAEGTSNKPSYKVFHIDLQISRFFHSKQVVCWQPLPHCLDSTQQKIFRVPPKKVLGIYYL